MRKICLCVLSVVLLLSALRSDAGAQYFGRNKVEYEDFDFRVLHTEHFDIYYYPREERAARIAARLAERWYARFSEVLNHTFDRRQPLVMYGSQAEFAQTNVVGGLLPDSVGGVTESSKRRIVMPFAPTLAETNRVLGHEIVHAFQFDIARRHGGSAGQPSWFVEGMAEYLARGSSDAESQLFLRDLERSCRLPERQRDAARTLSPYQYGHAFWAYLAGRFGDDVIEKALKPGRKHRGLKQRMRYATGEELDVLHSDWRRAVTSVPNGNLCPCPAPPSPGPGTDITFDAGRMQLGPSLSPDGRYAVFFSERDRLSIDLFLADVATGRIIRKVATTAASARFDSLQPLRSTGAWSPDSRWFAFAAVRGGRAALVLHDLSGRESDREIVFNDLGQVLAPTWSPDGNAIAFSALAGGFTDLYVYDLAGRTLRQLTDDAFADLHPAWSPDGHAIAFASERFTSDLTSLRFGPPQLGIIDPTTGVVRPVGIPGEAKQINPQWSSEGGELFFVANRRGFANVFRVALGSGIVQQVTASPTGVTGVTPTSPAISVAGRAPVLAYTALQNGRYRLTIAQTPATIDNGGRAEIESTVAIEPPNVVDISTESAPSSRLVDRLLADDANGLPHDAAPHIRDYSPRLSLEQIGQPYISSGGGPFGTFVRAGGGLLFGDMLGERRLGAALQIGNRLRDSAFEVRFLNQARRWNWGALVELEPSLRRYRRTEQLEHNGEAALLKQADYLQRVQLRAAGVVAYPFSRGVRLELTGGVRHAAFHRDLRSQVRSVATGRVLEQEQVESPGGVPTTIGEVGAALVGDTAVFGPTGPLLGSRYRFELLPSIGTIAFTRVVADYRHYFMPVRPYSIALRLLHTGRFGPDADDPRLLSNFLGSRYFVRGHNQDARACRPDATGACGGELIGSRLLVGNLELRFPIWGVLSRQLEYGPLPADAFIFIDAGTVWSRDDVVQTSRRTTISSVGGGIRMNAGGLPFEVAAVRALDGPRPQWLLDFGFRVGF